MRPLALGSDQTLVYVQANNLLRYDVDTGKTATLFTAPQGAQLQFAQVSTDGQWVLFSQEYGPDKLQLIRMDGQGLQTLYCTGSPLLRFVQWSIDQLHVAFMYNSYAKDPQAAGVWILDMQTGRVQQYTVGDPTAQPLTWLDNNRLYIETDYKLALLDLRQGPRQQTSSLTVVQSPGENAYWDFDTGFNTSQIFFALHNVPNTPNTVSLMPATGGPGKVIYSSSAFPVITVRAISSSTLLLMIGNAEGDQSHNGLWKMNVDGTGLTSLYLSSSGALFPQLSLSHYYWANVSRDRAFCAFTAFVGGTTGTQLLICSFNGAARSSTIATGPNIFVAGWTTM